MRLPLHSGVRLASSFTILTVRIGEPSVYEAIARLGLRVLQVRHPLPACQRIVVTRPVAVVVGPTIRATDMDCIARAAAEVEARLVELAMVGEDRIAAVLQRVVSAVVVERSSLPASI
jgi:hypothetical protein